MQHYVHQASEDIWLIWRALYLPPCIGCTGVCSILRVPLPSTIPPFSQCVAASCRSSSDSILIQIHIHCSSPLLLMLPCPSFCLCFNGRSSKSNYTRVWCSLLWRSGRTRITSPSVWSRWKCCGISPNTGNRVSNTTLMLCTSSRRFFI